MDRLQIRPYPHLLQVNHKFTCDLALRQLEAGLLHTFYTSVVDSICLKNELPNLTLTKARTSRMLFV